MSHEEIQPSGSIVERIHNSNGVLEVSGRDIGDTVYTYSKGEHPNTEGVNSLVKAYSGWLKKNVEKGNGQPLTDDEARLQACRVIDYATRVSDYMRINGGNAGEAVSFASMNDNVLGQGAKFFRKIADYSPDSSELISI